MKKIQAHLIKRIISSNSPEAYTLNKKSKFGERVGEKIQYTLAETLFLVEKGKMNVYMKEKLIPKKELIKKLQRMDKRLEIKYPVFKDLRKKGYIVKTALKFGGDFRVYEKGFKSGKNHAKWIVFVDYESKKLTWHEFSAKNRVAHSTNKKLLLAIVDEEGDATYYEIKWLKP